MDCTYTTSALKPEQLPPTVLPEVAFVGRSNVGKSSLLNAITGRKNLARYSRTPGRTQMVNFFTLNNKMMLVDLPGYGFRAAAKQVQLHWEPLMAAFFARPTLQEIFFLMDCRRDLDAEDFQLLRFFKSRNPVIVLTKSDKLSKEALKQRCAAIGKDLAKHKVKFQVMIAASSLKKTGIEELREIIKRHLYLEEDA